MTATRPKIVFQGEPGANSHIACLEAYPDGEPVPCPTFEDALNAVASGEADLGMIPIENSVAGRVADIHHLMPSAGLHIVAEWFLPIRNQLLTLKGVKLSEIKSVESHIMALGQCRNYIRKLGVKSVVAADTAGAAREVAERGDRSCAAIASKLAAEIYGLNILAENIEDESHSTTRFIVLSREAKYASRDNGLVLTTFVFQVRNIPAALYKALGGFATNGVNMTKLESYMLEGTFSATQFYSDVEGHPDDPGLALALEELAFFSQPHSLKILGVYPANPFSRHHLPGEVAVLTLAQANRIIEAIRARGAALDCRPLSVIVVEPGCKVKAFQKEDGSSMIRFEMALGKAYAALALGRSSKLVRIRNDEKPAFMRYLIAASGDQLFPEGGGMQIRDVEGNVIGAVGVTGDTEDRDEELAVHGIHAAGLKTDDECKGMGRRISVRLTDK